MGSLPGGGTLPSRLSAAARRALAAASASSLSPSKATRGSRVKERAHLAPGQPLGQNRLVCTPGATLPRPGEPRSEHQHILHIISLAPRPRMGPSCAGFQRAGPRRWTRCEPGAKGCVRPRFSHSRSLGPGFAASVHPKPTRSCSSWADRGQRGWGGGLQSLAGFSGSRGGGDGGGEAEEPRACAQGGHLPHPSPLPSWSR